MSDDRRGGEGAPPDAAESARGERPLTPDEREALRTIVDAVRNAMPAPAPEKPRFPTVNLVMFALTVVTTFWFGAYGFDIPVLVIDGKVLPGPGVMQFLANPLSLLSGWDFSVPLLAILVTHEMGHWVTARRHGVRQSLPYFIPFPAGFGTFGAVIRMDARVPDRNILLDIGVMGPIMGMVVALPVLLLGLSLSPVQPLTYPAALEGNSILYWLAKLATKGPIPEGWDVSLNNVALAGWLGCFLTMLNLFPIGQLDGGHVAFSTFKKPDGVYAVFNALMVLNGVALSVLGRNGLGTGFIIMGLLIFFFARRHPPVLHPERPLTARRKVLGVVAAVLFVMTYVPVPWTFME